MSLDCSASSADTDCIVTDENVTFAIAAGDVLDCTYNNRQQQGAILVTKTRKHAAEGPGDHPHAGVDFTVDGVTVTTDADGEACFDGLSFGDLHRPRDASRPATTARTTRRSTVHNNATCDDDPFVGETVAFHNMPLTDVTVSVDSQVVGGTASTMACGQRRQRHERLDRSRRRRFGVSARPGADGSRRHAHLHHHGRPLNPLSQGVGSGGRATALPAASSRAGDATGNPDRVTAVGHVRGTARTPRPSGRRAPARPRRPRTRPRPRGSPVVCAEHP